MTRVRRTVRSVKAWAVAAALCVVVSLTGGGADAATRSQWPVHVAAAAVRQCDGVTVVSYSLSTVRRSGARWVWSPLPDDGRATVEAHTAAGWRPAPSRAGGEGRARTHLSTGVDAVRVVYPGPPAVVSAAAIPQPEECP